MSYYNLNNEDFETAKMQLNALEQEHMDAMHTLEEQFIAQMKSNLERYDRDLRMSMKQMKWLADIYDKYYNKNTGLDEVSERFDRFSRR